VPLIESVLNCSPKLVAEFQSAINGLAVEKRGVAHMEMFFVYSLAATVRPQRIVESGRGRGQSTIVLARCFPNSQIISVESDAKSLDARFAQERLSAFSNVKCLFGDSRDIIPQYLMPGTVVVIDGPKEFRALKLMIKLIARKTKHGFHPGFIRRESRTSFSRTLFSGFWCKLEKLAVWR
jgi:tRNA A58 N-methylase Trm61